MTSPHSEPTSPLARSLERAPRWALPAAVGGGLLSAMQSRINARLAGEIGDGFTASAISFGTGLVIVAVIVLARSDLRARAATFGSDLRHGALPWPLALGGLGGSIFVLGQTFTVALIGVALFIVCVVAGQTVTGLVVDRSGLGPGGVRPLTAPRLVGAGLMVVSVAIAMSAGVHLTAPWFLLALPIVAGVAMGLQQAVNGRVSQHTGHSMIATLGNFVVGTTALVLVALVHALLTGNGPTSLPLNPVLYLGGAIGVLYIALGAKLAAPLGVLTLAMATIAGQIIGSVLLDVVAPSADAQLHLLTILGALLTLIAAGITAGVGVPRRR